MEKKHILKNTIIFLISFIGFLGGILIPIFGFTLFWMNQIDSWIYFVSFIIFALLNLSAIILMKNIPKEKKLIRYSFFLSVVGLCINGFFILSGLPGALYLIICFI
jgi:hypothetical protein